MCFQSVQKNLQLKKIDLRALPRTLHVFEYEVIRDSTVLGEELGEKVGTLNDKKELYEQLFFLLSTRPEYIAQLAHRATKRQQDDFVKTGTTFVTSFLRTSSQF